MSLSAHARLTITDDDRDLPGAFGGGCASLLEGVAEEGSLNRAAKCMGMAYSKAWRIVREAEGHLGCELLARDGATCVTGEESFLLTRPGREATHAGPLLARRTEDALDVLERGLDAVSGPIVIDVPDREREIQGLLADRGFGAERPYTRMARGRTTGFGEPSLVRAIAAPELG